MLSIPAELARSALDAAPDAMIIIDVSGAIRYANRQVVALFGYPHDDIIGRNVELLMPERFRHGHVGHRDSYTRNVRVRPMGAGLELFGRRSDGVEFPIEISLSPVQEGDHALVAAAIRDVTERKRIEAQLVVAREAAEHARELADRANLAKGRFLATASHDLRQPLHTLALLNGTLRRMITDPEPGVALAHQEQAIGAMSRLLNALLDISKLESGAIEPEATDFLVESLFEELRQEFSSTATGKGLKLEIESSAAIVHSDPSLVEQVLRNLVSNAIKYTRQGLVRVRCLHTAELTRIEVHDSGIGIPEDQIPYICDEFYQVGVPTHSLREGYGLGLNIVQRIVNLLDLHLEVKSEVGRGSVFALTLPRGTSASAAVAVNSGPSVQASPLKALQRILLVEDDPAVRNATRMLLKVDGYQVTAVSSIAEALRSAETEPIDLLVTDYHLAGAELGTELITALRAKLGGTLKAVLMTGDTSSAVKGLPADPYLRIASKPINAEELLTMLRTFPPT